MFPAAALRIALLLAGLLILGAARLTRPTTHTPRTHCLMRSRS